ncbi:MAG: DUF86 domain-containing protein [Candidatus Sungbacteria bacterium]|nr:DUF86 domain-containing protein [Candidatus Sungbacteria bacterium]
MSQEFIEKKLDQIRTLIEQLEEIFTRSFLEFQKDLLAVRAAERNFQLLADIASDISGQILLERGKQMPDTYRQSFLDLGREGILPAGLAETLAQSAKLRNILVHEYDFDEDYERFYASAKTFLPAYIEYLEVIQKTINATEK